jgi:two-component system sensor histidine kinase KdpD
MNYLAQVLQKKEKREPMPRHMLIKNIILTVAVLSASTLLAILFFYFGKNTTSVVIIYILAVVFISRYSNGYIPGIISSFIGVICVNYVFTYPFMKFNFTMDGYPVTFLGMVLISSLISTMTSHLKLQNRMIQEREKLLAEAEKETMRANLLRAISHDLRTPLTGMIGACNTYLDTQNSLSKREQTELIQNVYDDANWLLNMVENLLTITRIRTNETPIHKTSELLEEVISEAVLRFRKRIPDADIQVQIPEDFIIIPMDATLIEQVLINLLENAYYHGASNHPICLTVTVKNSSACIKIRDFGQGIPAEKLETIFDGSPSTPNQSGDSRKGMGIGLTICRTIITAHNGNIYASNHESGADITFCLPLEEENTYES